MTLVLNAPVYGPELSAAEIDWMTGFRFTDVNPLTGRFFCESRFWELPEFVQDIVEDVVQFTAGMWDVSVKDGDVLDFTGTERFSIPRTIESFRRVKRRLESEPGNRCTECLGTFVTVDFDASMTGELGAPAICHCLGR